MESGAERENRYDQAKGKASGDPSDPKTPGKAKVKGKGEQSLIPRPVSFTFTAGRPSVLSSLDPINDHVGVNSISGHIRSPHEARRHVIGTCDISGGLDMHS